jgi:hypothetical protein
MLAGRKASRDADRAGTGEGSDLDGMLGLDQGDEEGQQAAFVGADRHLGDLAELERLLPQGVQDGILRIGSVSEQIAVKRIGQRQVR